MCSTRRRSRPTSSGGGSGAQKGDSARRGEGLCRFLLVWCVALMVSGCAGYRLGPVNGLGARDKSIQINPFSNQTREPRLNDEVTFQLRKQVDRNGTYRLVTREAGDIIVSGAVTRYQREALSFQPNNLTVLDYRISLTAHVTASDRVSGKMLLNQDVIGHTLIRVGNDMVSAERQGLPLAAADLAQRVAALLSEGTW